MAQREGIQFLLQTVRGFATQVGCLFRTARILVRLLFVEDDLFFPPFVILQNQLDCRELPGISKVGQQAMNFTVASPLRIVELVFDDPNQNAATIVLAIPVALVDLRQIRSVRQMLNRFSPKPLIRCTAWLGLENSARR